MRPPICEVCDARFDPHDGGRLVRFRPTEAGRTFTERSEAPGFVGHPPDDGWFCAAHVEVAEALGATRTLAEAVAEIVALGLPPGRPAGRPEPAPPIGRTPEFAPAPVPEPVSEPEPPPVVDPAVARRRAEMQRRLEHRRATRVEHHLARRARRDSVSKRFGTARDAIVERLGLGDVEPETRTNSSTSPSPEWREAATATEVRTTTKWSSARHVVEFVDSDMYWDGWSGQARAGGLVQGTVSLRVDDTRLYASFGSDGIVSRVVESGIRTPESADLIEQLLDGLRFPT